MKTLQEAADALRAATIHLETCELLEKGLGCALKNAQRELDAARAVARDAESELVRISGGRFWNPETSQFEVSK